MISTLSKRPRRSGYTVSSAGCHTCRLRKIKCDESRPICDNCLRGRRKCEGYADDVYRFLVPETASTVYQRTGREAIWRKRFPTPPLSLAPVGHKDVERRSFQFFTARSSLHLSGSFDPEFWCSVVPRWANASDAVWQAVVALSLLQEKVERATSHSCDRPRDMHIDARCTLWYTRAVKTNQECVRATGKPTSDALIGCMLFAMIEFQQWNADGALKLFDISMDMFLQLHEHSDDSEISSIGKFFPHYWSVQNSAVPKLQTLMSAYGIMDGSLPGQLVTCILGFAPPPFQDLRLELYTLIRETEYFAGVARMQLDEPSHFCLTVWEDLKRRLASWYTKIDKMRQFDKRHQSTLFSWSLAHLLAYHRAIWILLELSLETEQIAFDSYVEAFEEIVNYAKQADEIASHAVFQPSFTVELNLMRPLLITAIKCRDSTIRNHALALMRQLPRQRRIWDERAIAAAQAIIEVEERAKICGNRDASLADILPEDSRVQLVEVGDFQTARTSRTSLSALVVYPRQPSTRLEWLRKIWIDPSTGDIKQDETISDPDWAPSTEMALRARHAMNFRNQI